MSVVALRALVCLLIGYALGSIPFGLVLTRVAGLGDIRKIGSGNIGATNVLRTGHKGLAAATLLCDMLKGTAGVLLGGLIGGGTGALLGGLGAFLGHLFPAWLGFKGGKGVATYIGVLAGVHWPAALVFCATWLIVAALSRYSSLAALTASVIAPMALLLMGLWPEALLFGLLSTIVLVRHHENIGRLFRGKETRIGSKG